MRVLTWGLALLAAAFLLHVAIWRIRVPLRQVKVVLFIFFGTLLAALGALLAPEVLPPVLRRHAPAGAAELVQLALLFGSVTLAYMITYSAVEVDSPSLHMVLAIHGAGAAGLPEAGLLALRRDDRLVAPRVRDLLVDKMAVLEGSRYRLTPKGVALARLFIFYRGVLGAGKGG